MDGEGTLLYARRGRSALALLACGLLVACTTATPPRPAESPAAPPAASPHRAAVEAIRRAASLPALVVGTASLDGDASVIAVGVRELGGTPVGERDLFHLGSAAKPLTADLLAILVTEGRVRWTSPVGDLLPDLLPADGGAFAHTTLRQLLAHEAGLPAFTEVSDAEWQRLRTLPGSPTAQRAAVAREILALPAAGPSGHRLYSNAGYLLAGVIAERLTGEPFEDLRRRRLLAPLHMDACREGWPRTAGDTAEPLGHAPAAEDAGAPRAVERPPTIGAFLAASGDLSCPADAVVRFLRWHLASLGGRATALPLTEIAVLHGRDPLGASPLGWGRNLRDDGTETQSVLGSLELFSALLTLDLTHERGYFALTNVGESPEVKKALVRAVQSAMAETGSTNR